MTVAASAPAVGLGSLTQPTPATRSSRFGSGVWMRRLRAEARSRDLGEAARELDTAGRGRSAARRELAAHLLGAAVPWRHPDHKPDREPRSSETVSPDGRCVVSTGANFLPTCYPSELMPHNFSSL